jgi:hypothetical protein
MIGDLAGDGDGAAGHSVADGDEERTSTEPRTARLATASPAEARKGTYDFGCWGS